MYLLVCFDIVDDKVRYRVVKALKNHGGRVQKSVFECADMTEERFLELKSELEDFIDHTEDTVRYYPLCKGCLGRVEYSGVGDQPDPADFKVV